VNDSKLVTIAAIKGACPAGGCITALACDYRIMTEKGHIGLNEVLIGVPVPKIWCKSMERLVGAKHADKMLMTGKMYKPQEALAIGMIDQVVPEESLVDVAEQVMSKWTQIPHFGVAVTKKFLKGEIAQLLRDGCEEEVENTWKILSSPNIVGLMEKYLSGLSKPKKAKSKL
jgi:3,2-trans-enoyl-CoA isomerase